MTDYFSDYTSFGGFKGLPSPADTPYETPTFLRSKRSSRATTSSSREPSPSPPPLPPDITDFGDKSHDGRFGAVDLRRFTPTLHASLVSEILSLRRELDSKNSLVENLETSLSASRRETEELAQQLSSSAKDVRLAKRQVQQMEKGTYDAIEELISERDAARTTAEELKSKLDAANRTTRRQDENALVTQRIWEKEKETWDSERRQFERRVHVTESRLRMVVDELATQQVSELSTTDAITAATRDEVQSEPEFPKSYTTADEGFSSDSGLGLTVSVTSAAAKSLRHRPTLSDASQSQFFRQSTASPDQFDPSAADSLADELGFAEDEDEDDELDPIEDGLEHPDPSEHLLRSIDSAAEPDSDAERVLHLTPKNAHYQIPASPTSASQAVYNPLPKEEVEELPKALYVDSGCQPSPPPSVQQSPVQFAVTLDGALSTDHSRHDSAAVNAHTTDAARLKVASPLSPPDTPVIGQEAWGEDTTKSFTQRAYVTAATQTDDGLLARRSSMPNTLNKQRHSLTTPSLVPSIAIHPPLSRPSTPQTYVLPPHTRNASTQASLGIYRSLCDASTQTKEIRVDRRVAKVPPLLPPTDFPPSPARRESIISRRSSGAHLSELSVKPPAQPSLYGSALEGPSLPRDDSQRDLRNMPLRAIPLPRPVLSPVLPAEKFGAEGPLNRSAQYGVTRPSFSASRGLMGIEMDRGSDSSDNDDPVPANNTSKVSLGSFSSTGRPQGRAGPVDPPKAVPEDKEMSPDRESELAGPKSAAPAPSIASSRTSISQQPKDKHAVRPDQQKHTRTRSRSFGSVVSSVYSTSTRSAAAPPYPIPSRSSSRFPPESHSEASHSPTPYARDGRSSHRTSGKHNHLRKTRSSGTIPPPPRKVSPVKPRRRRRSPTLTPVQSLAFDSPAATQFPLLLPEETSAIPDRLRYNGFNGPIDLASPSAGPGSRASGPSHDPNLVDAIAATMVGESMWKYIRKRKSFGVGEDLSLAGEDGSVHVDAHGSRHRRWVWLSPYERCIMWDNKQPTSGSALLGKKGRKLVIQSILDVPDESPLPRSAELASACNRSILILTPQRALKFTAISHERHALWMTALAFLAEPGRIPPHLTPAMPRQPPPPPTALPVMAVDDGQSNRQRSASFGRSRVRDSIRLTKAKRPSLPTQSDGRPSVNVVDEDEDDAGADFPTIPRLYNATQKHQRKRSNSTPRLPTTLPGLRGLSSSSALPPYSSDVGTAAPQPYPGLPSGGFRPRIHSLASSRAGTAAGSSSNNSYSYSRRDSLATSGPAAAAEQHQQHRQQHFGHHRFPHPPPPPREPFFETVSTVHMEAFVDPNVRDGVLYVPGPPLAGQVPGRRRGDSAFSSVSSATGGGGDRRRLAGFLFDESAADPFGGF